jgi:spore coat protein CotF
MNLPEDVLDTIYKYKHQIEFKDILNELIQHKINCRYNVTIGMLTYMFYMNEEGVRIPSIDVSDMDVFAFEILSRIKSKTHSNSI